jgi:cysteinyl-tRNA synthetase
MALVLYNTLSRRKELFEPLTPGRIKMYVCGVTVYDLSHLGHGRAYIVWDTVRRYLQWRGYEVTYVQNFTDIDDKIIRRAQEENRDWREVVETNIKAYQDDMRALNIREPDITPRATEYLPEINAFIEGLVHKEYAYPANGDVYYRVRKFPGYGKLSGKNPDQLRSGASTRVEEQQTALKEDPLDFALWKDAKPGEPSFESPFGSGRPGWHIECSAMVQKCLGDTVDIHAGGEDLQFPHHENEIAQSEAMTGKPLAKYWMHNGFIRINSEKMSKSLGNFTTIRALIKNYDPMALRLFFLQTHYRAPIDFTDTALEAAAKGWETIRDALLFGEQEFSKGLSESQPRTLDEISIWIHELPPIDNSTTGSYNKTFKALLIRFKEAMDNDFNTSEAIAILFELAKPLVVIRNKKVHGDTVDNLEELKLSCEWMLLKDLAGILGLAAKNAELASGPKSTSDATSSMRDKRYIEEQIILRTKAKAAKDFAEADRIRNELKAQRIVLIDKKAVDGTLETIWHREE